MSSNKKDYCSHSNTRFEYRVDEEISNNQLETECFLIITWSFLEIKGFEVCNDCDTIISDVTLKLNLDDDDFEIRNRIKNDHSSF